MAVTPEKNDDWWVQGDVPHIDPDVFKRSIRKSLIDRARSLGEGLRDDHKVVTTINETDHSLLGDHRKEIIIGGIALTGLSVAGLLAARHHTRVKHKK